MRELSTGNPSEDRRDRPAEDDVSNRLMEAAGLQSSDFWYVENAMLLSRIARLWEQTLETVLKPHGLIPAEMRVLSTLIARTDRELTMSEIKRSVVLTAGAVTKAVARLEAMELVKKHPSAIDKRSVHVTVTERGRLLARAALNDVIANFEQAFRECDASERDAVALSFKLSAARLQSR